MKTQQLTLVPFFLRQKQGGGRGRGGGGGRGRGGGRPDEWNQDKGQRGNYKMVVKENKNFEEYYKVWK